MTAVLVLLFSVTSCSNSQTVVSGNSGTENPDSSIGLNADVLNESEDGLQLNPEESMDESISLKDMAEGMDARIRWSQEMEGELLQEGVENFPKTGKFVEQTPLTSVTSLGVMDMEAIYPSVDGFAPVNYESYTPETRSVVDSFCTSLVSGKYSEHLMKGNRLYELMVFKYNIEKINKLKLKYAGYLLGEPFVNQETFQCPVRLFYDTPSFKEEKKYEASGIDFFIYLEKVRGEWKIVQLTFMPKEKLKEQEK